jgi:NADH:ubiquinone oxidoreductase subunit 4 (subunit M)
MEERGMSFWCFLFWVDVFGSWKFCMARTEWRGGERYFWVLFLLGILVVGGLIVVEQFLFFIFYFFFLIPNLLFL